VMVIHEQTARQDVIWPQGDEIEMKGRSRGWVQLIGRTCDVFIPDIGSGG
jgi:hypothetical protein